MPVSKKRKKDGKPVSRSAPVAQGEAHDHGPEAKAAPASRPGAGKPSNPFVAMQTRRAAQRGR